MSKNNNSSSPAVSALLARMQSGKPTGRPRTKDEVAYATTMMLMEVALCDHAIDRFEKTVIHSGLKGLFKLSDETANNLMSRAKANLSSMRGSSEHVEVLRDSLDAGAKRAVAQVMDNLIRCNGVVTPGEVYLRKRFREILGIEEEALGHIG